MVFNVKYVVYESLRFCNPISSLTNDLKNFANRSLLPNNVILALGTPSCQEEPSGSIVYRGSSCIPVKYPNKLAAMCVRKVIGTKNANHSGGHGITG